MLAAVIKSISYRTSQFQPNCGLRTFDVPMQLLVTVEVVQPAQKLPQDNGNVFLVDHTRS